MKPSTKGSRHWRARLSLGANSASSILAADRAGCVTKIACLLWNGDRIANHERYCRSFHRRRDCEAKLRKERSRRVEELREMLVCLPEGRHRQRRSIERLDSARLS
ncbi:unnamed protein product [Lampetra fluviatilis]